TKAVLPVHLYGQPADMDEINAIAKKHGVKVVEDAAQAHGSFYKKKRAGSLGDVACFSFYPTKNLGAFGDAGMAVTSDEHVYQGLLMLRDYGRLGRYEHKIRGYNSRLDTLQAVGLLAKLKQLDQWNKMRQQVASWYAEELRGVNEVALPVVKPDRTHVYHLFVVRVPNRDRVLERLKEKEVGSLIHYPIPVHLQEAYRDLGYRKGDFPVAEKISGEIISLPMFPHMTREQVAYVSACLKEAVK
ncbi:MAG TPA: DegT/DnrJ/EryC1/StrS family aminotransferase, partial [Candidatus Bathyarchaeia archaeon]|nr:DegT/DnrJ/EryC1/StrS family aminotransferase [Candidatus Bathyarchaeia archaeon]